MRKSKETNQNIKSLANIIVNSLLDQKKDDEKQLAVSSCFDDDDYPDYFNKILSTYVDYFNAVITAIRSQLGPPDYSGDHKDHTFPPWALNGYRVAFWKKGKRIIYLHIAHGDQEMPLQLVVGIVTGPPKGWLSGV